MVLSSESGFLYCKITKGKLISPVFSCTEVIPEAAREENQQAIKEENNLKSFFVIISDRCFL